MSKLSVNKSRKSSNLVRDSKKADEEFDLPIDDQNDEIQRVSDNQQPGEQNDEVDNLVDSAEAGQYDLPLDDGDIDQENDVERDPNQESIGLDDDKPISDQLAEAEFGADEYSRHDPSRQSLSKVSKDRSRQFDGRGSMVSNGKSSGPVPKLALSRQGTSPQHLKSKKSFRRKPQTEKEMKDQALKEIFRFYARQHIRNGVDFDQFREEQKLDQGELIAICKDFKLEMPKQRIFEVYKRVS